MVEQGESARGGVAFGLDAGVLACFGSNIGCNDTRTLGNPTGTWRSSRLLNGDWGTLCSSSCFNSTRSL